MSCFSKCPRCGTRAYEMLSSYAHCVECLYFEDHHRDIESCAHDAQAVERSLETKIESQTDEPSMPDAA